MSNKDEKRRPRQSESHTWLKFAAVLGAGIGLTLGAQQLLARPTQSLRPEIRKLERTEVAALKDRADTERYLAELHFRARREGRVTALHIEPGFAAIDRFAKDDEWALKQRASSTRKPRRSRPSWPEATEYQRRDPMSKPLRSLHRALGTIAALGVALIGGTATSDADDVSFDGYVCRVTAYGTHTSIPYVSLYTGPGCTGSYIEGARLHEPWGSNNSDTQTDRLHTVATTAAATDSRVTGNIRIVSIFGTDIEGITLMTLWAN